MRVMAKQVPVAPEAARRLMVVVGSNPYSSMPSVIIVHAWTTSLPSIGVTVVIRMYRHRFRCSPRRVEVQPLRHRLSRTGLAAKRTPDPALQAPTPPLLCHPRLGGHPP